MEKINLKSTNWRDFIPPPDCQRSIELANADAYEWAELRCREPFIITWREAWDELYNAPYKGITTDGRVIPNVHRLADETDDQGAPTAEMVKVAQRLLSIVTPQEREALVREVDAREWRAWMNPEIYISRHGIRLEEVSPEVVAAVHDLMRTSLSDQGYYKAYGCIRINRFLGEVVNGRKVLNAESYNFCIFGTPSETEPWGWQIFGHHFDMNCFVLGKQMVISPVFMGSRDGLRV